MIKDKLGGREKAQRRALMRKKHQMGLTGGFGSDLDVWNLTGQTNGFVFDKLREKARSIHNTKQSERRDYPITIGSGPLTSPLQAATSFRPLISMYLFFPHALKICTLQVPHFTFFPAKIFIRALQPS